MPKARTEQEEEQSGDGPEDEVLDLEAVVRERDELRALWQRAQADYRNLKRRSQADFEAASRRELQPFMESLLLVLDHLDMALRSPTTTDEARNLAMGVELTRQQLLRALEHEGVAPVAESGPFDPTIHQAVATVETDAVEPGHVAEVVRRGYTWRYGVLRHAQVKVAAGEPEDAGVERADEVDQGR